MEVCWLGRESIMDIRYFENRNGLQTVFRKNNLKAYLMKICMLFLSKTVKSLSVPNYKFESVKHKSAL